MRVAINTAVELRGVSGSAQAVRHIVRALGGLAGVEVKEVQPRPQRGFRVANAAAAARWDLIGAARASRDSQVLVSPTNIGRADQCHRHVLVMHDTMVLDHPEGFDSGYALYARLLFGFSFKAATTVVTPSKFARDSVLSRWGHGPPIHVIPWPTETKMGVRVLPPHPRTVLMVGRTEPHKQHETGLEAVRILRLTSGEDIHVRVIGPAGRAERGLQETITRLDPDRRWCWRESDVSAADLDTAYANAWVLLQPSLSEGFGLPVAEANGWGLPVIHSGHGSLSEVAPWGQVLLPTSWGYADALASLLDEAAYVRASEAGVNAAALASPDVFAGSWQRLLEELAT